MDWAMFGTGHAWVLHGTTRESSVPYLSERIIKCAYIGQWPIDYMTRLTWISTGMTYSIINKGEISHYNVLGNLSHRSWEGLSLQVWGTSRMFWRYFSLFIWGLSPPFVEQQEFSNRSMLRISFAVAISSQLYLIINSKKRTVLSTAR